MEVLAVLQTVKAELFTNRNQSYCITLACVAHARGYAIYCDQQSIPQALILWVIPQSLQDLDLQHIHRVYVRVAHVDQMPQHLIVLVQFVMACQLHQDNHAVSHTWY